MRTHGHQPTAQSRPPTGNCVTSRPGGSGPRDSSLNSLKAQQGPGDDGGSRDAVVQCGTPTTETAFLDPRLGRSEFKLRVTRTRLQQACVMGTL